MNKATITKTVKKAKGFTGNESEGFKKYMALPKRVALKVKISHMKNAEGVGFSDYVGSIFENMGDYEFSGWLALNG